MEKQLKVSKIINIHEAVTAVEANEKLTGKVSYQLGRLADTASVIVRRFQTERAKIATEIQAKQEVFVKQAKEAQAKKHEATVLSANLEIDKFNKEFDERLTVVMDQEESIRVPEFKSSDFFGKDGESLVPVKFFKLMGDLIID